MASHQDGHIHTRRTKKWGLVHVIVYRMRKPDGAWKQVTETVRTRYKKEAQAKLDERLTEVNGGGVITDRGIAFARFVEDHWQPHALETQKPSTRKANGSNIRQHLIPALGGLKLDEIQPTRLARLLREKREAGMSDKSRLNIYLLLASMFSYAISQKLLKTSPLSPQDRPKVEPKEKPTLTAEQLSAVIAALPSQHRALFITLATTGLRIGELLGLKWKDVRDNLYVRRSIWMGKEQTPKTRKSIRPLPVGPILKMALDAQRALSHYTQPEDYIFCAGNGHALYADDLRKRVLYPAMDKAGIAREARAYGFHLFRHTAGSEMQEATGDLKKTSSFLGHASTQITGDIYTHGDADQESAEKLEARLFPGGIPEDLLFFVSKTTAAVN